MATIIYTLTDEAPMLATYSFLPVVQAFASSAGVDVETRDISLAGRILALFPDHLTEEQRIGDALAELGELATTPEANIIKLPNISASMPQLKAADQGAPVPGVRAPRLPGRPADRRGARRPRRATTRSRAARSTRCCARATPTDGPRRREELRPQPPPLDGRLDQRQQDQRRDHGSRRLPLQRAVGRPRGRRHPHDPPRRHRRHDHRAQGRPGVLEGEVVDATVMRVAALDTFLREQIARAKAEDVLFSVHLKATMMKVSDPIIFGHVVAGLPPRGVRALRRRPGGGGPLPQQRARRHPRRPLRPAQRRRDQGGDRQGPRRRPAPGHGQLRQGHHQPARPERRHRRRVDAGDDPHVRPHVGRPTARSTTPSPSSPTARMPASTRPSSTTAAPTAPSTRRRWARSPTSA